MTRCNRCKDYTKCMINPFSNLCTVFVDKAHSVFKNKSFFKHYSIECMGPWELTGVACTSTSEEISLLAYNSLIERFPHNADLRKISLNSRHNTIKDLAYLAWIGKSRE